MAGNFVVLRCSFIPVSVRSGCVYLHLQKRRYSSVTIMSHFSLIHVSMQMSRKCVNSAVNFCYTYSLVTLKSQKRTITPLIKKTYSLYFGGKIEDLDKLWGPHIYCISCVAGLTTWIKHKRSSVGFAIPMIWRELLNHATDFISL